MLYPAASIRNLHPDMGLIPILFFVSRTAIPSEQEKRVTVAKSRFHSLRFGVYATAHMRIDLHGYHPRQIVWNGVLAELAEQAWEMGESELILIHGHGRNRGITPGFVNTNTGFFGLEIRKALRHDQRLRRWICYTTLNCSNPGSTSVSLKVNRSPARTRLDPELLPDYGIRRSGR
jgi:hypothetical protein